MQSDPINIPGHELIGQHVERVTVHADQIIVTLRSPEAGQDCQFASNRDPFFASNRDPC